MMVLLRLCTGHIYTTVRPICTELFYCSVFHVPTILSRRGKDSFHHALTLNSASSLHNRAATVESSSDSVQLISFSKNLMIQHI